MVGGREEKCNRRAEKLAALRPSHAETLITALQRKGPAEHVRPSSTLSTIFGGDAVSADSRSSPVNHGAPATHLPVLLIKSIAAGRTKVLPAVSTGTNTVDELICIFLRPATFFFLNWCQAVDVGRRLKRMKNQGGRCDLINKIGDIIDLLATRCSPGQPNSVSRNALNTGGSPRTGWEVLKGQGNPSDNTIFSFLASTRSRQ